MTSTGSTALEGWIGILTAPVVFLLSLQVSLAGVSAPTLAVAAGISLMATLGAGYLAWRSWRRPQQSAEQQDQFMGYIGVLETCFFVIALLALWAPAALARA